MTAFFYVATALTVYGIETVKLAFTTNCINAIVATALTVYGIETSRNYIHHR